MSIFSVEQKIMGKTYIEAGRIIFDAWKNGELSLEEYQKMANMYEVWSGGNQIVSAPFTTTTAQRAKNYEEQEEYEVARSALVTKEEVVNSLIEKQQSNTNLSRFVSPSTTTFTSTTTTTTTTGSKADTSSLPSKSNFEDQMKDYGARLTDIENLKQYGAFLAEFFGIVGSVPATVVGKGAETLSESAKEVTSDLGQAGQGLLINIGSGLGSGLGEVGSGLGSLNTLLPIGIIVLAGLAIAKDVI